MHRRAGLGAGRRPWPGLVPGGPGEEQKVFFFLLRERGPHHQHLGRGSVGKTALLFGKPKRKKVVPVHEPAGALCVGVMTWQEGRAGLVRALWRSWALLTGSGGVTLARLALLARWPLVA